MPTNPMFNTAVSPNKATAPTNKVNDAKRTFTVGRNTFNYSRPHYLTARYSDITPFECIHGVEGDVLEIGSKHSVRSHTLKAPLESKIFMKKSYFQVDMKAILPRNWNRFYINPNQGDDVIASDVNTFVKSFFLPFHTHAQQLSDIAASGPSSSNKSILFDNLMHFVIIYESVFSSGSLLNHLGFHTNAMCRSNFDMDFEELFHDLAFPLSVEFDDMSGSGLKTVQFDSGQRHEFLSLIRHNHSWRVFYSHDMEYNTSFNALSAFFHYFSLNQIDEHKTPLNYDCLCAYQIVCANFYSRDSVDYVFSAETYRDLMDSLWRKCFNYLSSQVNSYTLRDFEYEYNGQYYLYDALSGKILSFILNDYIFGFFFERFNYVRFTGDSAYSYFMNLFAYNENLRYGDYFTGSKPRPLAVGDVTAEVSNNGVNAIDMTVALARARFMNDVNRVGRRPEDYIEDITDGVLPPEITEPRFLSSVTSRVSGFEVENTADNQGNIVTILKAGDNNMVYSVSVGHPCIILGLLTFEIERVYSRTVDRFFFHEDRFDMFNRYLQRIGDQEILRGELDAAYDTNLDSAVPYSYTLRHMEYKQRYPIASGGFIDFLPGYLFVTDNLDAINVEEQINTNINPFYIRSRDAEMDQFYSSLSNYSLAGYFHFILGFDNICIAHRKMDYTPTIL